MNYFLIIALLLIGGCDMLSLPMPSGDSNKGEVKGSNYYYTGINDARSGRPPREPDNSDYMSGYNAGKF